MSLFTHVVQAQIDASQTEVNGKVLTRPALLISDGTATSYAVDVDIGQDGRMLSNVPIARANRDLLYAEPGNPVRLRRTENGSFEVVGFSNEMPGRIERFAVDVGSFEFGPVESLTIEAIGIPYGDLAGISGGYGYAAYGSVGIYRGGVLIDIRS